LVSMAPSCCGWCSIAHFSFRWARYVEAMTPRIHSERHIQRDYTRRTALGRNRERLVYLWARLAEPC
jgi:hypothetical protein